MKFVLLLCLLPCILAPVAGELCLLVMANNWYTQQAEESSYFILPGRHSLTDSFTLSYEVFVSPISNEGAMFSFGTKRNFKYYDNHNPYAPQYLAVEFSHLTLAAVMKTNSTQFYYELSVPRTWPKAYNVLDKQWHEVYVHRDAEENTWRLDIDDIPPDIQTVKPGKSNITIIDKEVFFGGRPDYIIRQFQGIFRNIRINGNYINLNHALPNGRVRVEDCYSQITQEFVQRLVDMYEYPSYG